MAVTQGLIHYASGVVGLYCEEVGWLEYNNVSKNTALDSLAYGNEMYEGDLLDSTIVCPKELML